MLTHRADKYYAVILIFCSGFVTQPPDAQIIGPIIWNEYYTNIPLPSALGCIIMIMPCQFGQE